MSLLFGEDGHNSEAAEGWGKQRRDFITALVYSEITS